MNNRKGSELTDLEQRIKQLSDEDLHAIVVTMNNQSSAWQPELKVIMDELAARKNKNRGA